ncbi:unnamed protein product [Amoebophrya sp. A25]|nr:unnamed protein product [Amoebophrya sp. A25]|eukprot:GSA25T00025936001.1
MDCSFTVLAIIMIPKFRHLLEALAPSWRICILLVATAMFLSSVVVVSRSTLLKVEAPQLEDDSSLDFSPASTELVIAQSDNIVFAYKLCLRNGRRGKVCATSSLTLAASLLPLLAQ